MSWKKYFKIKGIKPGPVHIHGIGVVNFANDNIDIQTIIKIYENNFPYLEITPEGKEEIYGVKDITKENTNNSTQTTTKQKKSIKHM